MSRIDNLHGKNVETQFRSGQEAVNSGHKGGVKSGEARRRKKSMREAAQVLMSLPTSEKNKKIFAAMGIEPEYCDNQMLVLVAMLQKAKEGNVKAAEYLRDALGENPIASIREKEYKLDKERFEYEKKKDAGMGEEIEDNGIIEALEGKIDESDWDEAKDKPV